MVSAEATGDDRSTACAMLPLRSGNIARRGERRGGTTAAAIAVEQRERKAAKVAVRPSVSEEVVVRRRVVRGSDSRWSGREMQGNGGL